PRRLLVRRHLDVLEAGEIDDQSAVVGPEPGRAVRTAAHREVEPFGPGDADDGGNVGGTTATDHGGGTPVDHAVVAPPRLLVVGTAGVDHLPRNRVAEPVDCRSPHHASPESGTRFVC